MTFITSRGKYDERLLKENNIKAAYLSCLSSYIRALTGIRPPLALIGFLVLNAAVIGAALSLLTVSAGIIIIKRTCMRAKGCLRCGKMSDSMAEMKAPHLGPTVRIADADD